MAKWQKHGVSLKGNCDHRLAPAASLGWFVCACGECIGVCFDCVPTAPKRTPLCLCDEHRRVRRVGVYWHAEPDDEGSVG